MRSKYKFIKYTYGTEVIDLQLANLIHLYYQEQKTYNYTGSIESILQLLADSEDSYYYVFYDKDTLKGFYKVSVNDELGLVEPFLYVQLIYILPNYRGTSLIGFMYAILSRLQNAYRVTKVYGDINTTNTNISNAHKVGACINSYGVSSDFTVNPYLQSLVKRYFE